MLFSFKEQAKIELVNSPLKIPINANNNYCTQFTDGYGHIIQKISNQDGGSYCGEFRQFDSKKSDYTPL